MTLHPDSVCAESLCGDDVHVWYVDLEVGPSRVEALSGCLSRDERARAARFRFERHRRRFVVRRAALRHLLSGYTGTPAAALQFLYAPRGKPELSPCTNPAAVHFNSSHSGEVCVICLSGTGPLGVDIERVRPVPEAEDIAHRYFSAAELQDLSDVPLHERERAFFNCWTRKEAYVKAVGDGLFVPLDSFDVTLIPGDPVRMRADRLDGGAPVWSLFELHCTDYVTALALECPAPRIREGRYAFDAGDGKQYVRVDS